MAEMTLERINLQEVFSYRKDLLSLSASILMKAYGNNGMDIGRKQ